MTGSPMLVRGLVGFLEGSSGLRRILDGVNLEVRPGRSFALLGGSGSGKTFLLHSLLGLHRGIPGVVAGEASIMGVDVFKGLQDLVQYDEGPPLRVRKDCSGWGRAVRQRLAGILGRSVTLVPQDPATTLSPFHTVGRMLEAAVRLGRPGIPPREARDEALAWLERVHMYRVQELARLYAHELSGGMAQRVALALALAPEPKLLVADEPTTGLDATLRVKILQLLRKTTAACGATLFVITHDTEAAQILGQDVAILCDGRVVEVGPREVVLNPDARPKHPYTEYLLGAERQLAARSGDRAIDGLRTDSPGRWGSGSCGTVAETGRAGAPREVTSLGSGHRVGRRKDGP